MKKHLWAVGIFIGLTFIVTWPLAMQPTTLGTGGGEEKLLSFIQNWNIHAFLTQPGELFNAPFFHPLENTLAFSDLLLTSSVIAAPFVLLFKEPFLAYGLNLLLAFVLNGFFTYLLVYKQTKSFWPSLLSGALFAFSIGRIDTVEHLQVFTFYWIPLGLLFLLHYFESKRWEHALMVAACFFLQTINTVFLGYVFALSIGLISVVNVLTKKVKLSNFLPLGLAFLPALIGLFLIFQPYLHVSQTYQYTRGMRDIWGGSSYILEYLYPTHSSRLRPVAERMLSKDPWPGYMGATLTLLATFSLGFFIFTKVDTKNLLKHQGLSWLTVSLTGAIMSLGPYLQIKKHVHFPLFPIPLPYLLFYYVIPGFKSMRVPQRWSHLALFGFSVFIGLIAAQVVKKLKPSLKKWVPVVTALLIALTILEIDTPIIGESVAAREEIPAVYEWLESKPQSVILELPAQTWDMPLAKEEINRLHYHSFILPANHRYINGFSGFAPLEWTARIHLFKIIGASPHPLNLLADPSMGANLVVVHKDQWETFSQQDKDVLPVAELLTYLNSQEILEKVYENSSTVAFRLKEHRPNKDTEKYVEQIEDDLKTAYQQLGIY